MNQEDISAIAAAVAKNIAPPIPLEIDLWSAAEIAAFLKVSTRQVTERIVLAPGFPKSIRLPMSDGSRMHPRWPAKEVIKWASKSA